MSQSGARQWRHECDCAPEVAAQRHSQKWVRMHSQVSQANAVYFIEENRLAEGWKEQFSDDLRREIRRRFDVSDAAEWLSRLVQQSDSSYIVCNVCGQIKEVQA